MVKSIANSKKKLSQQSVAMELPSVFRQNYLTWRVNTLELLAT